MPDPVSPATSFQMYRRFPEENQGFPVPASVRSVAFPSADGESICWNFRMCKTRFSFAQLIHHERWISHAWQDPDPGLYALYRSLHRRKAS